MKQLALCILCFAGIALPGFVNGQEVLTAGDENRYFEHIALYTDRVMYVAGERIWFKIKCNDQVGNPEIISKIAYLELYDQQYNSIAKGKFRITSGMATGFISIPSSIHSGNYFIRAYSQFLRNYSPYLYPCSVLAIINPDKPLPEAENVSNEEIYVVPEGGKLLAGVASRIAVRVHPQSVKEISTMAIINGNDSVVSQTLPLSNGLALFELMPEHATTYTLKVILQNGQSMRKPLPPVYDSGLLLKAVCNGRELKISLNSNQPLSKAQHRYTVHLKSETFEKLAAITIVPNQTITMACHQLNSEIVYLLLQDEDNAIADIQSVYIPVANKKKVAIKLSKDTVHARELVTVHIETPQNQAGNNSSLISVTLAGTGCCQDSLLPASVACNPVLMSNYLKSSGPVNRSLKSQVETALILYAAQYNTPEFKTGIQQEQTLEWLPEIRDASISGQVLNTKNKKPLAGIMVYASVIENHDQLHMYKTDTNGRFFFTLNHLEAMQHIYLCPKPLDSVDMELRVDADFPEVFPRTAEMIPFYFDSADRKKLDQLYLNAQVGKAYIRHAEKTEEHPGYLPLASIEPEFSIELKDFIEMPVMLEVFTEITPYVSVRRRDGGYAFNVYDERTFITYTDPLVLLDGLPVFDLEQIMNLSPEMVERVDVTNRVRYLGNFVLEGVISIHTSTKNFAGITFPKASEFIEYQAVTTESNPVFPEYRNSTETDRHPDFRNLLYWNPFNAANGNSPYFQFFSSDNMGRYEITFRANEGSVQYFGKAELEVKDSK